MINTAMILDLKPCKDRLENYLKHYKDFSGTVQEFTELEHLTDSDKRWVVCRVLTKEQRVKWAALCAQSVLHIFEKKYPDDKRPRAAIELMLSGNHTEEQRIEVRRAAYAAAAAAAYAAAAYAAAAYAADADAAYAAAAAADAAAAAAAAAADAAADADAADAAYAAYAAADADAADAAYAAADADAADAAADADAADAAADADAADAYARKEQNKKNWQFLFDVLSKNSGGIDR